MSLKKTQNTQNPGPYNAPCVCNEMDSNVETLLCDSFLWRWCHILSISRTKTLCVVVLCTTIIVKWQRENDIDGTVKIKMGLLPGTIKNNSPVNYFND